MQLHSGSPGSNDFGAGHVNEDGSYVPRLCFGSYCVEQELLDGMRGRIPEFFHSGVTREPRGVAHQASQPPMIGMLVLNYSGTEDNSRFHSSYNSSQLDGVG